MKLHKLLNISAGVALMLGASACSSDYLDLHPEGMMPFDEAVDNEEGATLAIYGLCQSMYKQYSAMSGSTASVNGEPWISLYYGDIMGQDYVSALWCDDTNLMNWVDMNRYSSSGAMYAWTYYYGLISQANNVITFAPKKMNDEGEVETDPDYNYNPIPDIEGTYAFRYAEALTIRAHAYTRLLQLYGARYEDRYDNATGEYQNTLPLRLEFVEPEGDLTKPLAKWDKVVAQIYADLQQAISLYEASNTHRTYEWEPSINVAKGLLARIAMVNQDWELAQQMAHEARQGYDLMTMEEYGQGFAEPNSEWMWTNSGSSTGIYYYSYCAWYGCNGAYPCNWGTIGAGGINNDLIDQAIPLDQRAVLYYSPRNRASVRSRFWGPECNSDNMDINFTRGQLHQDFVEYCQTRYSAYAEGKGWDAPYTYRGYPIHNSTTVCNATFGAQFKFWGTDTYSASYFPFMRASEMVLIEAEAAYMQGKDSEANDLLSELNSQRIRNYNRNYTGAELLNQIKLSRRLELWGEGFSWFDLKRWNEPVVRNAWVSNNPNSGNWPLQAAYTFDPSVNRGWRWRIPSVELNYNSAIDFGEATGGADTGEDSDI